MTPGGRALVAYGGDRGLVLHERAAAGEPFGPAARVGDGDAAAPAAALAPDGGAVVAWRSSPETGVGAGVVAASRAAPGPFGTPQRLALGARPRAEEDDDHEGGDDFFGFLEALGGFLSTVGTFAPDGTATPDLALAPGGAFTVAWLGVGCACERGDVVAIPRAASGTLAHGPRPAIGLGAHLRAADAAVAYLAHGEPGVAWADNDGGWVLGGYETPWRAGRIGASAPSLAAGIATLPKPPDIDVIAAPQRVAEGEPLRVRVACDAACDIRAVAPRGRDPRAAGAAALGRAGLRRRAPRPRRRDAVSATDARGRPRGRPGGGRCDDEAPRRPGRPCSPSQHPADRRPDRAARGRRGARDVADDTPGHRRACPRRLPAQPRRRRPRAVPRSPPLRGQAPRPPDADREGLRLHPPPAQRRRAPSERGDRVSAVIG